MRFPWTGDKVLSLYARGMSTGNILIIAGRIFCISALYFPLYI